MQTCAILFYSGSLLKAFQVFLKDSSLVFSLAGMKGFLLLLQLLFPFSEKQIKLPSTKTDETLWAAGQKEAKWTILKMLIFLLFLLSFKNSCCRL